MKFLSTFKNGAVSLRAFLLGMAASFAFYFVMSFPSMQGTVLHTYTTQHITEYVIVILFMWANSEHLFCYLRTTREAAASNRMWLPARTGLEQPEHAEKLLEKMEQFDAAFQNTMMYQRIRSALRFVNERRSADGYREYLETLASRDADTIYGRYGFSRFVSAILPIIGLIGTVVHFGTALSGLTIDGLTEKLPELLGGMGTAFNTTCAAMSALSITLLVRFLVEKRENAVLHKINNYIEDELLYRFRTEEGTISPFLSALSESHKSMLETLALFEQNLADQWNERFDLVQNRWEKVDQTQHENLVHFLGVFEKRQLSHVKEVHKLNEDLVLAQKMMNGIADAIMADGKLLELQDRLAQNLALLGQTQQLENAMHELTSAIHLFAAKQSGPTLHRKAA